MSNPLLVTIVVTVIVVAILLLRSRMNDPARTAFPHSSELGAARDFAKEHEDARVAGMTADDRAWEAASLQRNRDMTARSADLSEDRV